MFEAKKASYVGRFAPSPTGPLHLGSLIAALASYLDARDNAGQWLLRVEDIDPPREVAGSTQAILESLKSHGLIWDGDIFWQHDRNASYLNALNTVYERDQLFYCTCTRHAIAQAGGIYPGTCRKVKTPPTEDYAARVRCDDLDIVFDDLIQGEQRYKLQEDCGDFIILRKDKLIAYQLAVVVDDAAQNITRVVRGADLMDSTPLQLYLQRLLGFPSPEYCHIPIITDQAGHKFSKQTFATALDSNKACDNLRAALAFLQQPTPPSSIQSVDTLLQWATKHWSLTLIPPNLAIAQR